MKIEVGDRVTYKDGYVGIVLDNEEINYQTVVRDREIIKVERIGQNGWEVVEEKKELLTEEEREFLKAYLKFMTPEDENMCFKRTINKLYCLFDDDSGYEMEIMCGDFFKMENDRKYTSKELRIGGINENRNKWR